VYHAFSASVQPLMSFSFVVATLYMVALLVSDPIEMTWIAGHSPPLLVRFDYVVKAWGMYASFVLVQKMPSPYHSMAPCICVSSVHITPLAAKSSPYSALCPIVSLLGDAT
jgi:hypothetical protein